MLVYRAVDRVPASLIQWDCGNRHNFVSARRTAVFGVHPLIVTFSMAAFLQGIAYFILPAPSNSIPAGLQWLASAVLGGAPIAVSRSRSTAFPERPF